MKKEEFIKLGLDEETAKKCESASQEELKGFIPKSRFDEVNNEKKKLELDVRERDTQLETLKNSTGDVEGLKKQIEDLQAENTTKAESHAAEIKQLKIDSAVEAAISGAKGRNAKAIKALLNLEKAEIGEDGIVKGLSDQIKALTKADDSKFLFEESTKPQFKGANPSDSGNSGDGQGGVNTSNMTYSQLVKYAAENPDVKL